MKNLNEKRTEFPNSSKSIRDFSFSGNSLKLVFPHVIYLFECLRIDVGGFENFRKFLDFHQNRRSFPRDLAGVQGISSLDTGFQRATQHLHLHPGDLCQASCGLSSETSKFLVSGSRGFRREPIWDPPEAPRNSGGECFAPFLFKF